MPISKEERNRRTRLRREQGILKHDKPKPLGNITCLGLRSASYERERPQTTERREIINGSFLILLRYLDQFQSAELSDTLPNLNLGDAQTANDTQSQAPVDGTRHRLDMRSLVNRFDQRLETNITIDFETYLVIIFYL